MSDPKKGGSNPSKKIGIFELNDSLSLKWSEIALLVLDIFGESSLLPFGAIRTSPNEFVS